jgi:uncharacterized membrane protein YvbJ
MAAKFCSNCNEGFGEDAIVCKYCGRLIDRSEDGSSLVEIKKSRKSDLTIAIVLVVLVIIVLVMMFKM